MKKITIILLLALSCVHVLMAEPITDKKKKKADTPKELEELYDDLLVKWTNNLEYYDDCSSQSDEVVSFSDSIYINRLHSLPTEMELSFNGVVRNYIDMYAGRRRDQVSYMLGEGKYYFPMMENILDREGIPLELKYLPIIESALNPIARSRVGATGLWQFMAATGRLYKLEINSLVDERRDPVKSTEAAAKYLKAMYGIYGDWNLVIAAYNCGPGNVNKAIRRSGGKRDYWAIYPYLPRETRGYVPAFIAATYIMNYYEEHNICPAKSTKPASLDTLEVKKNIHFEQISSVIGINIDELRKYNPEFKSDIIPGEYKAYTLNMPFNYISDYISNEDSIVAYRSEDLFSHRKTVNLGGAVGNSKNLVHRVRRGDTLSGIAGRYGVSVSQIKEWNNMRSDRLTIGHRLAIYKKVHTPVVHLTKATPTAGTGGDVTTKTVTTIEKYRIQAGDTWAKITKKYGVTKAQIKKWNHTQSNALIAGRYLGIEQTKTIEVEEPVKLTQPEMMVVTIEPNYLRSLIGNYVSCMTRDENSAPLTQISLGTSTEEIARSPRDESRLLYHKVKVGENINQIATKYKVSTDDIIGWNKLPNTSTRIGQRLLIYLPLEPNTDRAQLN